MVFEQLMMLGLFLILGVVHAEQNHVCYSSMLVVFNFLENNTDVMFEHVGVCVLFTWYASWKDTRVCDVGGTSHAFRKFQLLCLFTNLKLYGFRKTNTGFERFRCEELVWQTMKYCLMNFEYLAFSDFGQFYCCWFRYLKWCDVPTC